MPTSTDAVIHLLGEASIVPTSPATGAGVLKLENATGGRRWKQGSTAGTVDTAYRANVTLGIGGSTAYNLLAAGALTTMYGATIDLDELMALELVCNTGEIRFIATAGTPLSCFLAAGDAIVLSAGQSLAFDFGTNGLTVSTNSLFTVTDSGGAGSTYSLWFVGRS